MERMYVTDFQPRYQKKKQKIFFNKLIFVCIGLIGIYILYHQVISRISLANITSPLPASSSGTSSAVLSVLTENPHSTSDSLLRVVDTAMEGTTGTYGIVIRNLKTGETYYRNERKIFETGSLYKLWVMATVMNQIQNGQLDEQQTLTEQVATLNELFYIDPEYAEQTEGIVTFTVHDALYQMITISHNYAALLLTEKVKLSSVDAFLKEHGFTESIVGTNGDSPTATPSDIALFFEKLYKGQLADKQYSDEMIGLLKDQQLNDGLPKYLPQNSEIANKTGEIDYFKHDAGIVFTGKGDYIVVIMSESDFPAGAQERIALVSKAVYEYFTGK